MSLSKQTNTDRSLTQATEPPVSTARAARHRTRRMIHDITVFPMLGTMMFCSKLLLEWAPNIHLLAMLLITFTLVYRVRALIPLYIFVLLTGLYGGFNLWWMPYLYIWLPLWGITMLLPRRMKPAVAVVIYMALGLLHGVLYGVLYAPAQAILFGLDARAMLSWIAAGLPFDLLHGIGNLAACTLVLPLVRLLRRLEKRHL